MARKRRRRRRRRLVPRWVSWLGLGAVGLASLAWLRRPDPMAREQAASAGRPRSDEPASLDLPTSIEPVWIPGPAGALRLVEQIGAVAAARELLPVVLVHGLGGRLEHWARQLAVPMVGVRAIAFDLPGHGGSDAVGELSIEALAGAIGAVANGLSLRRLVIVAHSLGATAAIAYAERHPERVAGLLLIDPNGDQTRIAAAERAEFLATMRRDPSWELAWYYRQLLTNSSGDVADRVLADLDQVDDEVLCSLLESAADFAIAAAVDRIDLPMASVISPLNDLPYSLHRLVPELPVYTVREAGHWLMLDRPDQLAQVLEDFLNHRVVL